MSRRPRDRMGYLVWRIYAIDVDDNGPSYEWAIDVRAPAKEDAEAAGRSMFPSAILTVEESP